MFNNPPRCWLDQPRNVITSPTGRFLSREGVAAMGGESTVLLKDLCISCAGAKAAACQLILTPTERPLQDRKGPFNSYAAERFFDADPDILDDYLSSINGAD